MSSSRDVSFISSQSRASTASKRLKKKKKIEPYISPFILNAKKIADERARKALSILKPKSLVPVVNDWDLNTKSPGLFDPTIKKKEIFRIEPRRPTKNESASTSSPVSVSRVERISDDNIRSASRITMRTNDIAPARIPVRHREVCSCFFEKCVILLTVHS
jgi:hypothetical protein